MIPVRKIQSTISEPTLKEEFSIRQLKELMGGKNLEQGIHRHDFYYLLAIIDGKGTHEIDFQSYEVKPNVVYVMKPGQVHQHLLSAGASGFLMAFQTAFYPFSNEPEKRRLLNRVFSENYYQLESKEMESVNTLLNEILNEHQLVNEDSTYLIRSFLDILMVRLSRTQKNISKTSINTHYDNEQLDQLHRLIELHYFEWKEVSNYAKAMNVSITKVNNLTKKTLGKTCIQLLHERILLEAKRLLLSTTLQVSEIAFQIGYEDHSYFIRFFKKRIGVTPNQFRLNH